MEIPGDVPLCQASDNVSCGACCGLYNVSGWSRKDLTNTLTRRTEIFATVARTAGPILDFAHRLAKMENNVPPLPDFHHCPYLGLVGEGGSRVGCLLHPLSKGNNGVDFRGLSYHGSLACHLYFCPTHREVNAPRKKILKKILADWYEYGFVITEADFINAVFDEIDRRLTSPLSVNHLRHRPKLQAALHNLLTLKLSWPFRRNSQISPVHYFFNDDLRCRQPIDYQRLGLPVSSYDPILTALETQVDSTDGFREAENRLSILLGKVIAALDSC